MILLEVEEQEEELDHDQKPQRNQRTVANPRPERELSLQIRNYLLNMDLATPFPTFTSKNVKKAATLVRDGFSNIALITVMAHFLWK